MNYKTAFDFRKALTDRLNRQAKEQGVNVMRLMKRVAFERFLARLFHTGGERWVLKGGYALELRLGSRARATQDLDLKVPPPPLEIATSRRPRLGRLLHLPDQSRKG